MSRTVRTVYDVRREKYAAELRTEQARRVREARAKVRHWKRRVEQFGGEVQMATLARMEQRLAEVLTG